MWVSKKKFESLKAQLDEAVSTARLALRTNTIVIDVGKTINKETIKPGDVIFFEVLEGKSTETMYQRIKDSLTECGIPNPFILLQGAKLRVVGDPKIIQVEEV